MDTTERGKCSKMDGIVWKNRRLNKVTLHNGIYILDITIKKSFIEETEEYSFILTNRYNENKIRLDFDESNESTDDYYLFNVTLPFQQLSDELVQGETWDVSIERKKDDEYVQSRIKTRDRKLHIHAVVLEEIDKMYYPFSTKKGNLSFTVNDYKLFSIFENLELLKDGTLRFAGSFHYAPLKDDALVDEVKLLVKNNLNEEEIFIPVQLMEREDHTKNTLKHSAFKGEFSFEKYIDLEQMKYFMFYTVVTYRENGAIVELESTRMKCNTLQGLPAKRIVKVNDVKMKIRMKATKVSKFLSVSSSRYNFKNEVVSNLKNAWVRTRRSKRMLHWYKAAFALIGLLFPVNKKLVVFESFAGKQYSDNPRAIYEYMKENYPGYELVWSVDRASVGYFQQKDVKFVRRFSIRWLFLMTRAKYWVNNARLPLWLPKPKHTVYLQTWHGTPLKRLAMDMEEVHMPGTNTEKYKTNFIKEASNWDYLVSPNEYSTEIFKRAFQFDRKMIESGYPRNDFLHNANNEETINELKQRFELPLDKKIILYAPTWRDNQFFRKGKYKFNLELDLQRMREELGDSYIVIMRMHYLVAQNMDLSGYEGFAYDFSHLEDIRELYLIADIMITDYSSVFFDYANLRRPMIFFTYDIEDYRDNLRGFYFDFEATAPGKLTMTTEELIAEVKDIEKNNFQVSDRFEEFYQKFCYLECGQSSKRVVDEVFLNR